MIVRIMCLSAVLVAPPAAATALEGTAGSAPRSSIGDKTAVEPLPTQGVPAAPAPGPAGGASLTSSPELAAHVGGPELAHRFSSLWQEVEHVMCPHVDVAGARITR